MEGKRTGIIGIQTGFNKEVADQIGWEEYIRNIISPAIDMCKRKYEQRNDCKIHPITEIIIGKDPICDSDGNVISVKDIALQKFRIIEDTL